MPPNSSSHFHDQTVMGKSLPFGLASMNQKWDLPPNPSCHRRRVAMKSESPSGREAVAFANGSSFELVIVAIWFADLASSVAITQTTVRDLRPSPRGSPFSGSPSRQLTIVDLADGSRSPFGALRLAQSPPIERESVTDGENQRNTSETN
ncbi:hypothetical protein TIFTF001_040567 [Ficus carica]|uniref:Uncharacterized protein n=1 Tax=Ficus carica TaxID=3494 RepID=A0AA88D1N6_FICCA|nr:hypothetical protein TIFTF001_040567 [Ficus carica]